MIDSKTLPLVRFGRSLLDLSSITKAFQILSSGLVTTGTTGADLFSIVSGAETALQSWLLYNDTIEALAGNTGTAASPNAAGGADTITLSGGPTTPPPFRLVLVLTQSPHPHLSAATLFGGDGNDTITTTGINFGGAVKAGAGADSVTS